ncbi:NUDIX hydrolase [Brevibacillus sp. SYSU BS000544]|uniref:NUDIX hydrolase n=1 Tax=Brevibacillus sp. SYSU BS000544 TaxID=3416443 RepID=UPI003CE4B034
MIEISAGGVVYRQEKDQLYFLLIEDRYGKMTLAKGKLEPGETLEEAAIREILEETSVHGKLISPIETVYYMYNHPVTGEKVNKEVHYYLIEAMTEGLTAQIEEIRAVHWFKPLEAWKLQLKKGYKNNESVLKKALTHFKIEV